MSKLNNKNLIIFGILSFIVFFAVPSNRIEAAKYYEYGENKMKKFSTSASSNIPSNDSKYQGYATSYFPTYPDKTSPSSNQNVESNPKPIIDSISPNTVNSGDGEMYITIYGEGFVPNSIVKFNSSDRATYFQKSTKLKVKLTETDINGSGEYLITVFNPLPGGGNSNVKFFTILGGPTEEKAPSEEPDSNLGAAALFGRDGFFPTSFMGWLLLSILILLGVILWRKLYLNDKEKHVPLKHA